MADKFRILSLNGGGLRGIFQAVFLSKISQYLEKPLWKNFDLICGTSTGAIVGMAVAMETDIDRVVDLYKEKGAAIFKKRRLGGLRRGPLYNQAILKKELEKIFVNKQLKDANTRVLITSASVNKFDHRFFTNFPTYTRSDENLSIVDSILSSTAAPTFFPPFTPKGQERAYVDGGVWANTPSALGILIANKYLHIPINQISLLSVGTGDFPTFATVEYFNNLRQFSVKAVMTIFELMFASQSSFADQYSKEVLGRDNYLRISANLDEVISLDDVNKAVRKLPSLAEHAAEIYCSDIQKLLEPSANGVTFLQKLDREKLVSDQMLLETGLTAFYPERDYYRSSESTKSIDAYIDTAKHSLIIVSISLVKGVEFDNLRTVLERKLEDRAAHFEVVISLLNPRKDYLVESISSALEKSKEDLVKSVDDSLNKLTEFRSKLSKDAQSRFKIRVHNTIPFGSAIIIDQDEPYGKIQIETKAYKAPYGKSFAFEVMQTKKEGFYHTLLSGYRALIADGESLL